MHRHPHVRSATAAIAAVLALGSTPLLAQVISPTGETVILTPAPAAPPAVVPQAAPPATTDPVVQSLPATYVPAKTAAPVTSTAPSATAAKASPIAKPAPRAAAPVAVTSVGDTNDNAPASAPADEVVTPADDAELFPASETAIDDAAPAPADGQAASPINGITIVAGIVGILVLLALALLVTVSRRRREELAQAPARVTRPIIPPQEAPVLAQPVHTGALPDAREKALPVAGHGTAPAVIASPALVRPTTLGTLPSNGAAVDLPAALPESYEERDALLKRMIEAKPDKANPFTDRKARMKRARLILQSLGRTFADTDPWIDFSQYPNNWPELARRRYPQAA